MIFGSVELRDGAVHTHRDSYLIDQLSVVSVRRPLLAGAALIAGGLTGFALAFGDLLYLHELMVIIGVVLVVGVTGTELGQLKLLSRDLRGSELSGVIFGRHRDLDRIRHDIAHALRALDAGGSS